MRRKESLLATVFAFGALVGGALPGGCANEVPERPSYAHDIAPLMTARCTRCHQSGNPVDPDMPPIGLSGATPTTRSIGDFTTAAGAAINCSSAIFDPFVIQLGMPPPPSDKLDDWSIQLIQNWCAANQPP